MITITQKREGVTLMKTDWARSHTESFRTFLFEAFGGVDATWKAICKEKNILNGQSAGKSFYWIKYV